MCRAVTSCELSAQFVKSVITHLQKYILADQINCRFSLLKSYEIKVIRFDTQLYISVPASNPNSVNNLVQCISDIKEWMSNNFLKLNDDKTEILLVGPKDLRDQIYSLLLPLSVKPCEYVKY